MRVRAIVATLVAAPWLMAACTLFTPLGDLSNGAQVAVGGDGGGGHGDGGAAPPNDAARSTGDDTATDASPSGQGDGAMAGDTGSAGASGDAGVTLTLASGRANPAGLAVGGSYVYWVERAPASLWRVAKTGGSPERVDVAADAVSDPFDVAVSATTLYWTEQASAVIAYRPLIGGTRQNLPATGAAQLAFMALDGTTAYATDDVTSLMTSGHVYIDSPAAGSLFTGQPATVSGIDVRAGLVVFAQATYDAILSAPVGGGAPSYVGYPTGDIAGLAFDGNDIYFIQSQRLLMRMHAVDGATSRILDLGTNVGEGDVATDGSYVYWSEPATGKIRRTLP